MRNNSRPAIIGAVVALLAFGGTRTLVGQQETRPVPSDTLETGQIAPADSGTYAPASSDTTRIYAPPRSDSGTYAPPDSATYAPPDSAIYAPPNNPASAPPQGAAARTSQDGRETLLGATLSNPRLNTV
jgi:hypothetical protein